MSAKKIHLPDGKIIFYKIISPAFSYSDKFLYLQTIGLFSSQEGMVMKWLCK